MPVDRHGGGGGAGVKGVVPWGTTIPFCRLGADATFDQRHSETQRVRWYRAPLAFLARTANN